MAKNPTKQNIRNKQKTFTKFLNYLEKSIELKATEFAKESAKNFSLFAVKQLSEQAYLEHWPPLSEKYLNHKIIHGYDTRLLIKTREYIRSIHWGVTHGKVWAGIPSRKIHEGSGLPVHVLAKIHEYGTTFKKKLPNGRVVLIRIPARPFWRFAMRDFKLLNRRFAIFYRKEMDKQFKSSEPLKLIKKKKKKK